MTVATSDVTKSMEELKERIRSLEERISVLEGAPASERSKSASSAQPRPADVAETWQGFPSITFPGFVPTLGKAVLGLAGAYLLRAIAESGSVPGVPILLLAIAYAGLWMVLAVRNQKNQVASVTFAITSTLILSPMLWESTVRFQYLSPLFSGFTLLAFCLLTVALAWERDLGAIPWLATVAAMFTALALIIATRDLVPLTAAVLATALLIEMAACFGRLHSLRIVPALAADLAVWLSLFVMTSRAGVPEGYKPISETTLVALWFALVLIYVGGIAIRGFWYRERIGIVDIVQGAMAFIVAGFGAVRATHSSVPLLLGGYFLVLGAGCYWSALSRFSDPAFARNRRISATWAAMLLVGSSFLLFAPTLQVWFLCVAAVCASLAYSRTRKSSFGVHASLYLATAAAVSPLPDYLLSAFAGKVPAVADWGILLVTTSAAFCYFIGSRTPETEKSRRLIQLLPAALFSFAVAALTIVVVVRIGSGAFDMSLSRLSVIRTMVTCLLALGAAFVGVRWKRTELSWVAYAVVVLGTVKLLFEDLRFGNAASLVMSLLFYGLILILLPRMMKRSRTDIPLA